MTCKTKVNVFNLHFTNPLFATLQINTGVAITLLSQHLPRRRPGRFPEQPRRC